MSDERNADSVLFKLDTLTAMQSEKAKSGAPKQLARLAAPAPQSEAGSGLIDLKTLGGTPPQADEAADGSNSDLTSSAALSQSSLLSSSSMVGAIPTPAGTPAHRPAPAPSRTPMIVLSILALIALVAAVTAIVLRG